MGITRGIDGYLFAIANDKLNNYRYAHGTYQGSDNVNCSETLSNYTEISIEKSGLNVVVKVNGTTYMTKTLPYSNSDTLYTGIGLDANGVVNVKELTIKPL